MILKFQRKNIIESESSSGDSDTNNKFDSVNLMEHRNPLMRLVIFGKLKKIVTGFKDQELQETDKRLIRGLFVKHIKDFDDEYREKMRSIPLMQRIAYSFQRAQSTSSLGGSNRK